MTRLRWELDYGASASSSVGQVMSSQLSSVSASSSGRTLESLAQRRAITTRRAMSTSSGRHAPKIRAWLVVEEVRSARHFWYAKTLTSWSHYSSAFPITCALRLTRPRRRPA